MVRAEDALDLLLPGCAEATVARARRVVHFLRLLGDDAHAARASSIGVDLERAREELEADDRRRLERALFDLLRHHLGASADHDSFLAFGETALGVQAAWRVLDEHRTDRPWLAGVPEPDERALAVAARLLGDLERLGVPEAELCVWRARLVRFSGVPSLCSSANSGAGSPAGSGAHARSGTRAAERLLREQLAARGEVDAILPGTRRALIAGVAECLLDRGAVREARAWLLEHGPEVEGDARLRHLLAWTRLCLDDSAGARSLLVGLTPWSGPLPTSLAELREVRPEWLPCLAGRARPASESASGAGARSRVADVQPLRERAEIGASVLAVFVFRPAGAAQALLLDVAPALRERVPAWLAEREEAPSVAGEREHELVVGARAVVAHRVGESALAGALGRDSTLALALAPVHDEEGEVAGWLHIECEHHLLPSRDRLERLAYAWRVEVLARRNTTSGAFPQADVPTSSGARPGRGAVGRAPSVDGSRRDAIGTASAEIESACARVFRDLVRDLGIKTAQRRWWGFALEDSGPHLVAIGGEGAGFSESPAGRRRALVRALATGGTVLFEEPDSRLSIDESAGSGAVIPLRTGRVVRGLLAIESSRRRDFRDEDLQRFRTRAEGAGLALRLAQFRGWHHERFGFDVWFDAGRDDFQLFAGHLLAAARTRSPVVLCGPAGSGKQVLARWLHFESRCAEAPLKVHGCGSGQARGGIASLLGAAEGGSLLLDDVEDLAAPMQEELLRWLEGADCARTADRDSVEPDARRCGEEPRQLAGEGLPARIFATARMTLSEAVAAGRLRQDLARRLDRMQIRVPALKDRREDVLPLVECLARRFASEEGIRPPEFSDEALSLLWRQPWEGNVRELESLVYKLVLLRPHAAGSVHGRIEPQQVLDIAARFSVEVVRRLPSRHPHRSDLLAALRVTRKPGGKLNKTRAAAYLGWDPDTLVARMQEAGIGDEGPSAGCVWRAAPDGASADPAAVRESAEPGD